MEGNILHFHYGGVKVADACVVGGGTSKMVGRPAAFG